MRLVRAVEQLSEVEFALIEQRTLISPPVEYFALQMQFHMSVARVGRTLKGAQRKLQVALGPEPDLVERDVALAVNMMLDHIAACLAGGDRIEIRGFGSFTVRFRRARVGPQSQDWNTRITCGADSPPAFKPGKPLREGVNGGLPFEGEAGSTDDDAG